MGGRVHKRGRPRSQAGAPDVRRRGESWRAEGREGRPRLVACLYYALGPNADRGGDYIRDYYSYFGPGADDMARSIPSSPKTIEELIRGFSDIGADEGVCWPTVAELDQVDRLAEIIS